MLRKKGAIGKSSYFSSMADDFFKGCSPCQLQEPLFSEQNRVLFLGVVVAAEAAEGFRK